MAAELDRDADMALLLTGFKELCANLHPQCRFACAQAFASVLRHATSRRCTLPHLLLCYRCLTPDHLSPIELGMLPLKAAQLQLSRVTKVVASCELTPA